MQGTTPPRPDLRYRPEFAEPPAPRKRWTWWKIGLVILGLYIVGSILVDIGSVVDENTSSPPPITRLDPVAPTDINLEAARIAWDVGLTPSEQTQLCDYYNTPPVGLTPDLVRAFDSEAHLGYAESERVLSTVLAEEC